MLPFCRIAIRTKEDGYLDQKGLREHDRDEDEAVQNHPRIQDQGLETLPLFQCDFARLQRQFMVEQGCQMPTRLASIVLSGSTRKIDRFRQETCRFSLWL